MEEQVYKGLVDIYQAFKYSKELLKELSNKIKEQATLITEENQALVPSERLSSLILGSPLYLADSIYQNVSSTLDQFHLLIEQFKVQSELSNDTNASGQSAITREQSPNRRKNHISVKVVKSSDSIRDNKSAVKNTTFLVIKRQQSGIKRGSRGKLAEANFVATNTKMDKCMTDNAVTQRDLMSKSRTKPNLSLLPSALKFSVPNRPKVNSVQSHVSSVVSSTLYLLLESLAQSIGAESGTIYTNFGDKMVSCVNIKENIQLPPCLQRQSVDYKWPSAVFATKIALNFEFPNQFDKVKSLLMFPILKQHIYQDDILGQELNAFTNHTALRNQKVLGVLQFVNKYRGNEPFTPIDEQQAIAGAKCIALIMQKYPVNLQQNYYDPAMLNAVSPYKSQLPLCRYLEKLYKDIPNVDISQKEKLFSQDNCYIIHRSKTGSLQNKRLKLDKHTLFPIKGPTLLELNTYLENTHESWRQAVEVSVHKSREIELYKEKLEDIKRELHNETMRADKLAKDFKTYLPNFDLTLQYKTELDRLHHIL